MEHRNAHYATGLLLPLLGSYITARKIPRNFALHYLLLVLVDESFSVDSTTIFSFPGEQSFVSSAGRVTTEPGKTIIYTQHSRITFVVGLVEFVALLRTGFCH